MTELLAQQKAGDEKAHAKLVALVYADLRRLARRHLAGSRWMATLNTTSLVSESYLRLIAPASQHVQTRAHFFNLASRIMRQVVCDFARKRLREERRIDRREPSADKEEVTADLRQADLFLRLDEALNDLARSNPRQAHIVECRFFAGLSEPETAAALNLSLRSTQREWQMARDWLSTHMREATE
ncbi:MAG TPA: ECF-type sigma factor [Rudaea sp.]|nr:ECF-type sigma factor [Rudaea sp.]